MTLKQLEAFVWCTTCANFAIAAERLNISVSSVSKRISELESALGVALFDRSGYRVMPSEAGQKLLPHAIEVLDKVAAITAEISLPVALGGCCAIGVGELVALTWLPRLVLALRTTHPELKLDITVDVGASLEEKLDRGELDMAIVAGRSSRPNILSAPLTTCRFVWMASPQLVAEQGKETDVLLKTMPLVALPPSAGTTRLIDDWLIHRGISRVSRLNCNNWYSVREMLALSVGVGILHEGWAAKAEQAGTLCPLQNGRDLVPLTYSFQCRRGDQRALVTLLHDHCRAVATF